MRELDKVQNDPSATAATRDMVAVIRNMYKNAPAAATFEMQTKNPY